MAAIIDGSTHPGFFKLYDDATPEVFTLAPKSSVLFTAADATSGAIKVLGNADVNFGTASTTEDENGNALDTSAKVALYLSGNRQY